jgi:hypothetical protein
VSVPASSEFVGALGEKAAERWTSALFGPATLFWVVGLALWVVDEGSWNDTGDRVIDWFGGLTGAEQVLVAIGALLVVTALDALVRRLAFPVLQLMEGYRLLVRFSRLTKRKSRLLADAKAELDAFIAGPDLMTLTPQQLDRYSTVAELVRRSPSSPAFLLPTQLGNILRGAETWPRDKYGLDGVICWSRLWLLLDEEVRAEIAKARQAIDDAVVLFIWGGLVLLAWGPVFFFWVGLIALPIALAVCAFAYWWTKQQATVYADLVEAVYDVRRGELYHALRLPKPKRSSEEPAQGEIVTSYLWWREQGDDLEFVDNDEDGDEKRGGFNALKEALRGLAD